MIRPLRRRWPVLVLPFFMLRAMVPVGFMWAPFGGGEFIRLCGGLKSPLAAPAHAGHGAGHAGHENTGHAGHEDTGHPGPVCPFFLASVSFTDGPSYVAFEVPWAPDAPPTSRPRADKDRGSALPIRIRGPPFLTA